MLGLILCVQAAAASTLPDSVASPGKSSRVTFKESTYRRNLLIGNATFGSAAYIYMANTWGAPTGRFHIKREFSDHLACTDEVSHFFAGYKLTQGFSWLFKSFGMDASVAPKYSALQAATILTMVEFPLDAYNPTQGFGLSDLACDYGGIAWALIKEKYPNNFDMKFSVKQSPWRFKNKFLASTDQEFDNFIWWATYKPKYAWIGFGYSANHYNIAVQPEAYLGVGTTIYDLLQFVSPKLAGDVKFLDSYFINLHYRL